VEGGGGGRFFADLMGENDLDSTTKLYAEMSVCTEFLGCSHQEFLRLPKTERKKLQLFAYVKSLKIKREREEMELPRNE